MSDWSSDVSSADLGLCWLEASGSAFPAAALEDWAVMVLMGQRVSRNAALVPENGVEAVLMQRFADAGKPIAGLETARSQLMLFETLDPRTQPALLTRAAKRAGDAVAEEIGRASCRDRVCQSV